MLAPFASIPAPPLAPFGAATGAPDLPEDPEGFDAALAGGAGPEVAPPDPVAPDPAALVVPVAPLPLVVVAAAEPASVPSGNGAPAELSAGPALLPVSDASPQTAATPWQGAAPATAEAVRPPRAEAPDPARPDALEAPAPQAPAPAAAAEPALPPDTPPAPAGPKAGGAAESALRHLLTEAQAGAPLPDPVPQPLTGEAASPPARAGTPTATPPPAHHQAAEALATLIRDSGAQVAGDSRRVELVLTPEELGRIRFDLTPGRDGLQVTLVADRPETLDLLRRHAGHLLAELEAAGFGGATLDFGGGGQAPTAFAAPDSGEAPAIAAPPAALPGPPPPARPHAAGLDLRL